MQTKATIMKSLEEMNIDPKGTLMLHSSYKSIGGVEGGPEAVIDAFMEYMKDGLLVIPTHTWHNVNKENNPVMDVLNTPVCIGIIPELFRKRENVIRTWHPTHSVGVCGKDAVAFADGEQFYDTPCARGSAYGKLLDSNATILLLGVDYTRNTYIHGVEEWNNVPGRLNFYRDDLYVITPQGEKLYTPQRRHSGGLGSETYWKLEPVMLDMGAIYEGTIGNALVKVCNARKVNDILSQMLVIDIELLSDQKPIDLLDYKRVYFEEGNA